MSTILLDGKKTAKIIKDELKEEVSELIQKGIEPTLAVVLIGKDPASQVYVRNKKRACEYIGMKSLSFILEDTIQESELLELINDLNNRKDVHGILVQLPLPKHIHEDHILLAIDPKKDVDGFHPINVGNLSIGSPGFVSCTPAGIIELLKRYDIPMSGKKCVIIGRSNIVGKPIALLMLRENATVTICHSRTQNLQQECRAADIIIAAIGKANFFTKEFLKKDAVVVDVGMNRLDNGKLCGDVAYEECFDLASAITPVPGGIGPMTIAMLMKNCVFAAKQ